MTEGTDSFPQPHHDPRTSDESRDEFGPGTVNSEPPSDRPRSSKALWVTAALVIALAGAAGLWFGRQSGKSTDAVPSDPSTGGVTAAETRDDPSKPPVGVELAPAELYFAGSDGRLHTERCELAVAPPAERARSLVEALLAGPSEGARSGLRSPLPAGSRVEAVYLLGTTALLDLRPPEPPSAPATEASAGAPTPVEAKRSRLSFGSKQELLAVYSLVNTVVMGVEGVDSVQILWDGRQPETLAGHVDTTRPLGADSSYLASR